MQGLTEKEVEINRKKYGTNEIKVGSKESFFRLFIESLGDPIIKILLVALAIKMCFLFDILLTPKFNKKNLYLP